MLITSEFSTSTSFHSPSPSYTNLQITTECQCVTSPPNKRRHGSWSTLGKPSKVTNARPSPWTTLTTKSTPFWGVSKVKTANTAMSVLCYWLVRISSALCVNQVFGVMKMCVVFSIYFLLVYNLLLTEQCFLWNPSLTTSWADTAPL